MNAAVFKKIYPKEYQRKFLSESVRSDGRAFLAARKMSLTTGSVGTAVGSAMVKLGRTTVVAGVTATLDQPTPNSARSGSFSVSVHPFPVSANKLGSASKNADVSCLSDFIREHTIPILDLEDLCVLEDELVWRLILTIYCLDNDGNLEDASLLAATAALHDVRLPTIRVLEERPTNDSAESCDVGVSSSTSIVDAKLGDDSDRAIAVASAERTVPLKMQHYNVSVSFAICDGKPLLDPSSDEEEISDSRMTFVMKSNHNLRAVYKPGGMPVSQETMRFCIQSLGAQLDATLQLLRSCEKSMDVDARTC